MMPLMSAQNEEKIVWKNKDSGKAYKVIARNENSVTVQRLADGKKFNLTADAFGKKYQKTKKDVDSEAAAGEGYIIVEPDPQRYSFDNVVLHLETTTAIRIGIARVTNRDRLEEVWNISRLEPEPRTILNFYGDPGTGKTLAARCIASGMNKKMVQADYSQLVSSLHGQTAKHLHQLFLAATQHDSILFFDEADALVSKRISMHSDRLSIASAINTERNAFMQELDRFNGIVILTTNFFKNFDDAMVRRVAQHVQFKKPNRKMRVELFKSHVPNMDRVREIDWDRLATRALGLTGGDIFQAVVNAINAVSLDPNPDNWWLTEPSLNVEVDRILEAKAQHSGSTRRGLSLTVKPDPAGETPPPAAPQLED